MKITVKGLIEKAKEHKTKIILGALGVASAAIAVVLLNTKSTPEVMELMEQELLEAYTYGDETETNDVELSDEEETTEE